MFAPLSLYLISLFAALAWCEEPLEHKCIHDEMLSARKEEDEPVVVGGIDYKGLEPSTVSGRRTLRGLSALQEGGASRRALQSAQYAPIRITLDFSNLDNDPGTCYSAGQGSVAIGTATAGRTCGDGISTNCLVTCDSANTLTAEKKAYIRDVVIPKAASRISEVLSVIPVSGNLVLPISACGISSFGRAVVAPFYSTTGVAGADYVIFVTGRPTVGSTIAYAADCALDDRGRPIAGHFNWGPNQVDSSNLAAQVGIAVHELSHALGFSGSFFSRFIDPVTGARLSATLASDFELTGNGSPVNVQRLVTPAVAREVRAHFGCPSTPGGQIENQGGAGTSGSHWEKRLYMNEYMTGTSSNFPVLSRITLGAFEDSGWYKANYTAADTLLWGRGLGCDFTSRGCSATSWTKPGYFCEVEQEPKCTFDRRGKGICGLVKSGSPIPTAFALFKDTTLGGYEVLADYCPFVAATDAGECQLEANLKATDTMGQAFGEGSRCFENTLILKKEKLITNEIQLGCFKTACVRSPDTGLVLNVKVGSAWYVCEGAGVKISPPDFAGHLICPDAAEFCEGGAEKLVGTFPSIDGIVPVRGPATGGTRLTVFGQNFLSLSADGYSITLGGQVCRALTVTSTTEIECVTPKFELGFLSSSEKVDMLLTTPEGITVFAKEAYTFSHALGLSPRMGVLLLALVCGILLV